MAKTLTTRDLQQVFGVTAMTIYNWRQGSATREPLPVEDLPGVNFSPAKVRSWAKAHGIPVVADPAKITTAGRAKPGPRRTPQHAAPA